MDNETVDEQFRTDDEAAFWREAHQSYCRSPTSWKAKDPVAFADSALQSYRERRKRLDATCGSM